MMRIKRMLELRNNKGAALLYAVMVLLFLAMSAVAFTILATTAYQAAARDASRQQSFYYAKSVGHAISDQIVLNYNMSDIVKALDIPANGGELYGSYSIEKIGLENQQVVNGTDNVRFYYPDTGNKNFIYIDVVTTYNGVTEVVTTVLTCVNETELTENMFNLFSVYNIYSTSPNDQRFAFATTGTTGVSPSVYLYNGEGQPAATFNIENNISAELTSNGNVTIKGDIVRTVSGQLTSYGDLVIENIIVDGDVTVSGDLYVNKTNTNSKINYHIYIRGNATIKGTGKDNVVVGGNIYATGNVTVQSAKISGSIYGGENSNVTLTSATVAGTVNTRGKLTATSSVINGNIFTGQNLSLTSCTVLGMIESRGTGDNVIKTTTVGTSAAKKSVFCYGNLNLNTGSIIYGNVIVEGTMRNTTNTNISTIHGNLTVKKPYSSQIGGAYVVLLRGLTVNGNVDIRGAGATAMFSTSSSTTSVYQYDNASSCKVKITGLLMMNADFSLGSSESPTLLNLNGAHLNNVQAGNATVASGTLKNVKVLGGRIEGKLIANSIDLTCVELPESSSLSARKPPYTGAEGGNITLAGRSGNIMTINGKAFAQGNIVLGDYCTLPASDTATVRAQGNGEIRGAKVYGELIVDGDLVIKGSAALYGNEIQKFIYVNGNLAVDVSTGIRFAGSTTETANRIYVYGNSTLYGKLGDLYLMGEDIGNGDKLRLLGAGAVNGVTKMLTDLLIIEGNRGGAIMDNPNSIVYFKGNSTITGDQLKVAGTLIIPQSLTISMPHVYANKIITPDTPIAHSDNMDLTNKLRALSESNTAVINAKINGNFMTNSTLSTSITFNGNVGGNVNLEAVRGNVNITGTVGGTLHATNSPLVNLSGSAAVERVNAKNVTLSGTSKINKDLKATGAVTVNSGCTVGDNSTASNIFTLAAASVTNNGGKIQSNVKASGAVTIKSSATITYNVNASSLTLESGTIAGDVKLTSSTATNNFAGTINGSILSAGNIVVTAGMIGAAGSKFIKAPTLNMSGGSVGAKTNIHLNSTSSSVANYIRGASLNDVRVDNCNLTTIDGAVVNGSLYVGGSVYFANVTPSAVKGLYASNSTQSIGSGSFGNITGPVQLPYYTGTASFAGVSGELYAPKATIAVSATVGGNIRGSMVTLHPITSINTTYLDIDASLLKIYNYSSGTMTFNGVIACNTLVVNCDVSTYTAIGTSYDPPGSGYLSSSSASRNVVKFNANVRVDYLNSDYRGNAYIRGATFNPSTLYADGGIYSKYCDFYSYGYTDMYTHASYGSSSDGYYKTNYGSFYAGLDSTYTNNVYFDNCSVYSNIDIRRSSSNTFKSCIIGVNRNSGDWKKQDTSLKKKFSKYYRIVGNTALDGTRIYGVTDEESGEHKEPCKLTVHIVSGNLVLSNSSSIGWYSSSVDKKTGEPARGHKSSFDGIYLTGGNLTNNSGCVITLNVFVKGNLVNNGIINLKGSDGVNYCGGYVYWYGSKSGSGWVNYDDISTFLHDNHGKYAQNSNLSEYTPNGNWQLIATDYTTAGGNTTLNSIVNIPTKVVSTYNTNYFTTPSYVVTDVAAISFTISPVVNFASVPEEMKKSGYGGMTSDVPWLSSQIQTMMGTIVSMNPAALPGRVQSTETWNPLAIPVKWYEPTSTVAGETVKLNNRANNTLSVKVENIGLVGGSVSGRLGLYAVDAARYKYASGKINDILSTKGGNDMILYTKTFGIVEGWPWDWYETKRQVGIFFFESGIVPINVFNGTYREDNDKEGGRLLWGNPGALGSGGDCVWTFFTCADPRNPYASAAKDLHIILPENVAMQWSKDKDNSLNIIGNGRVFLYLRNGANIKVVGNGFANWISGVFGGSSNNTFGTLRYADKDTGVVTDNATVGKRQPRLFLVGVGGSIKFEVYDFQTFAYVYMPRGYSYSGKTLNEFKITASSGFFSSGQGSGDWDIIGMYVTDKFSYDNAAGAKVNYVETVPDLSNTVINGREYRLSDFWDYPEDLPRAGLTWRYKGIVVK